MRKAREASSSTPPGSWRLIAETMMGEGGIIIPPKEYYKEIKKVLDKYGILLFLDEVQCGYGRSGKLFAVEHYDVEPDIMTFAKGIADGFPLSAFIARPEIADSFKPGDHLSTFGGNPVSCAAGLANLNFMLREKIPEKALAKGEKVVGELRNSEGRRPHRRRARFGPYESQSSWSGQGEDPRQRRSGKIRAACGRRVSSSEWGGYLRQRAPLQPPW
jgi:4-aminobutyrate aminotransferase-like enzyme